MFGPVYISNTWVHEFAVSFQVPAKFLGSRILYRLLPNVYAHKWPRSSYARYFDTKRKYPQKPGLHVRKLSRSRSVSSIKVRYTRRGFVVCFTGECPTKKIKRCQRFPRPAHIYLTVGLVELEKCACRTLKIGPKSSQICNMFRGSDFVDAEYGVRDTTVLIVTVVSY